MGRKQEIGYENERTGKTNGSKDVMDRDERRLFSASPLAQYPITAGAQAAACKNSTAVGPVGMVCADQTRCKS